MRQCAAPLMVTAAASVLVFGIQSARAADEDNVCSETARLMFRACGAELDDNGFVGRANCVDIDASRDRAECLTELAVARNEGNRLCEEQRDGRFDACSLLGEDSYDPDVDLDSFDNPKNPSHPNPYFPLRIGNRWTFRDGSETSTVEVLNQTKLISGVTCVVVRDLVWKSGALAEATDDWYAPDKDGTSWYFGEEVKDYRSFAGDRPKSPELVKIDGSFKAGRDGSKPGVIFRANPSPGDVYLEEFSLGNA